ncbi:hypothetical protein [Streptomyces prunicolor]|uniref:Uncharacterized protein n=1 Tax=Streptomyces prunicolor TaxID=67348 RepID=A0ABU4FJ47_9ACTN|nr:hypothetical protein [Streptomyces prunicolor]MDV7220627.1 hypothetical protein [Streptomyces prunicolor]
MQHDTETGTTQDSPRAFGWCAWHKGHAENVRLIDVHEQGSGVGGNLFACEPCRETHRLVPLADRPL